MKFVRTSCINIPKCYKDTEWYNLIKSNLNRASKAYNSETPEIKLYYEEDDFSLRIPRFYPVDRFNIDTEDNIPEGEDISYSTNIKPRNIKQENAIDWMVNNKYGTLCMNPGDGKTVVAIEALSQIGKKAIIFVHKLDLLEQWKERFIEHSNLSVDDIGVLTSTKYKKVLSKSIILTTVQTVCSMLKNNPDFASDLYTANFGVGVWDECHTSVSAELFSKSSLNLPAERLYGLSATPERSDGNTDIMFLHLGEVFIPEGSSSTMEPKIIMLHFDHKIIEEHDYKIYQKYLEDGNPQKGKMNKAIYLNQLVKSERYVKIVKNIVTNLNQSARQAIVLADRINLLEELMKFKPGKKANIGLYVSKTKKDRESILQKDIIFSSYQMSRDGLDVPRLDSVIFCSPVSNIEQAVGRVVRTHDGKKQPIIIDIVDSGCPEMVDRARYRRRFYLDKSWQLDEKIIK